MILRSFLIAVFTLFLGIDLHAQVRHVDPVNGSDVTGCGTVGSPCQTPQFTVDNIANDGDTVYLISGTYTQPSTLPPEDGVVELPADKSLHFIGDTLGSGAIIDGGQQRRGFHYDNSGGCPASNGPHNGVQDNRSFSFHNLTIQNCHYAAVTCGSTTRSRGGGIFILGDPMDSLDIRITNSTFIDNLVHDSAGPNNNGRSSSGGAVYLQGRVNTSTNAAPFATAIIDSCQFTNNGAVQDPNGGWGGAVALLQLTTVNITNSNFCNNFVFGNSSDNGDLEHDRNAGGAVLIFDNWNLLPAHQYTIDQCNFFGNSATTTSGAGFSFQSEGGAVFLTRGDGLATITNSVLTIGNSNFFNNFNELGPLHIGNNSGTLDTSSIGNNVLSNNLTIDLGNDTTLCGSDSILLSLGLPSANVLWSDSSTADSLWVTISTPDTIWVEVNIAGCALRDTIIVSGGIVDVNLLGNDTAICSFDSLLLDPGLTGLSLLWQDSSANATFLVDTFGVYWFVATDSSGCLLTDTISIDPGIITSTALGNDTSLCLPFSFLLDPGIDSVSYIWQNNSTDSTFLVDTFGMFWFQATDSIGCLIRDTVTVSPLISDTSVLGNDTALCLPFNLTLDPGFAATSFIWQDSTMDSVLVIDTTGTFWFLAQDTNGCFITDTIVISPTNGVLPDLGNDTSFCSGFNLTLNPGGGFANYLWQDSSSGPVFAADTFGTFTVTVTDTNGCMASDTMVISQASFAIDLGNDTVICDNSGTGVTLDPQAGAGSYLWQDSSTAPTYQANVTGNYWVSFTDTNGCSASDSINVTVEPQAIAVLGNDTTICAGEVLTIVPQTVIGNSFLWSDSSTGPTLTVSDSGLYSLMATSACGSDIDIILVSLLDCACDLTVPNVFTPNQDGRNEAFLPTTNCQPEDYELTIFNRWGDRLFASESINIGWDGRTKGRKSVNGTYFYMIRYQWTSESEYIELHGHVTLLR